MTTRLRPASFAVPTLERARLESLATTDDLTLAYSGRYLLPRLRKEIEQARHRGQALCVAMLDLDHFEETNETEGHGAGDRVLRIFADRVRERTSPSGIFVRYGRDEFVLVLPATECAQAAALAERIRDAVTAPIELSGRAAIVQTVSIGVASWDGEESAGALVHRADFAMYEAKLAGRNRVVMATPRT